MLEVLLYIFLEAGKMLRQPFSGRALVVLGSIVIAACMMDTAPRGLRATPGGPGARVIFETSRRPLPEIPLPNDVATFADPTSRTGLRINVSLIAPSAMERKARAAFTELEGWGTYAPLTVAFEKSPKADPNKPALNLDAIRSRMPKGDFEFPDDPVYLVNLKTGVPVVLDMGSGSLPIVVREPERYGPNDPHADGSNLLFETREEGAGLSQAQYRPELDKDFDGVLDHPNTHGPAMRDTFDNLLTWYERETDTLILRPLIPMVEKSEYAVVLTDRLVGSDDRPVLSAFDYIHHPAQRAGAARVREILGDTSHANYYGDLAGTGLDHVAFVWTFTTQPVQEDLRLLRDGLYGKGPFARFATEYPPKITATQLAGPAGAEPPPNWQQDPKCVRPAGHPYIMNFKDPAVINLWVEVYTRYANADAGDVKTLKDLLSRMDHMVVGEFESPYMVGKPGNLDPDAHFHLDFRTGQGDVYNQKVQYWMWVPRATATSKQPFPITLNPHGHGSSIAESIDYATFLAGQGVANVSLNLPLHGLVPTLVQKALVAGIFGDACYGHVADAVFANRAVNTRHTGDPKSGDWFWTGHFFNVRDNVRQSAVDMMQLVRILRSFDGKTQADQDYNNDGQADLAGDFDADGVPDVGGSSNIFAMGGSLGGIMSQVHGGVDHQLTAVAPIVGGGGLTDIAVRSYGVATVVFEQGISPQIVAIPVNGKTIDDLGTEDQGNNKETQCAKGQRSVRFVVNQGEWSMHVEVACLNPDELSEGMTVVATNVTSKTVRCGATGTDGRFFVPLGAAVGDRIDIQVYRTPHAVTSYGTCELKPEAVPGRRVQTFEQRVATPLAVVDEEDVSCSSDAGCAQFGDRFYPVGSPLVSPQDGPGFRRQSPDLRRFVGLGQVVLEPGDPINYAPYYLMRDLVDPDGKIVPPRGLLNTPSIGDNHVAILTGIAFSRAAGLIPFFPPDAATRYPEYIHYVTPKELYDVYKGKTPNQLFAETYTTEGIAWLKRTPAGPNCKTTTPTCKTGAPADICPKALFDLDWVSEGRLPFDQAHLDVPLRLARRADLNPKTPADISPSWAPRIQGAPFTGPGWTPSSKLLAHMTFYSDPYGVHGPAEYYDCDYRPRTYLVGLLVRFIASGGTDVHYLSNPRGHGCLATQSCDFQKTSPN